MDDLWENAGSSSMTHGILKDADGRSRSLCMSEEPSSGKLLLNLLLDDKNRTDLPLSGLFSAESMS